MKIISAQSTKEVDRSTIEMEGITSIDLMERAATAFCKWIFDQFSTATHFHIVCGNGNNGGDGMAISRMLAERGYDITTFYVRVASSSSADFNINLNRLKNISTVVEIENSQDIPVFSGKWVIDALFGSGLSKPIEGVTASLVESMNKEAMGIISVDMPSGLYANSKPDTEIVIHADFTLTFQLPKLSFMAPENEMYVGGWLAVDIGLSTTAIDNSPALAYYVDEHFARKIYVPRKRFSHKGTFGHALMIAGSIGKMGAAILATRACLKAGAGLVTAHVPECGAQIMQATVPEAMCSADTFDEIIAQLPDLDPYDAIGIGPGFGQDSSSSKVLGNLFKESAAPIVIDADAINLISSNKLHKKLPKNCILTPHPKEFERLAGASDNFYERLSLLRAFAQQYEVIVILKGANTAVAAPNGTVYFNSTGNPGMGTAGSGDVLTGIITALLSQGYEPLDASILGVYLHGKSGDFAEEKFGQEGLTAQELIANLGMAFKSVYPMLYN